MPRRKFIRVALVTKLLCAALAVLVISFACTSPQAMPEPMITTTEYTTTTQATTTTEEPTTVETTTTTTTTTAPPARAHNMISTLTPPPGLSIVNNRPANMVKRYLTGTGTAYYWRGLTATGVYARSGFVAVDPRVIPYGSHLWIVSNCGTFVYGYAIAVDTGGFVHRSNAPIVDIHLYSPAMVRQFGVRGVTVYVLDKPRVRLPWNQSWAAGEVYSHRLRRGTVTDAMLNF
ncbi:MAG: 3D domain-containing protein [Oscillospiraceae bacterium]|nr:3D domain-containing protein [Oscillospiraceae bacterium]